jgi:hypothetical protein
MLMLGMSKDHTEAATITPAANPNNVFCILAGSLSFIKKTQAAPSVVPAKGTINAINNPLIKISILTNILIPFCCGNAQKKVNLQKCNLGQYGL